LGDGISWGDPEGRLCSTLAIAMTPPNLKNNPITTGCTPCEKPTLSRRSASLRARSEGRYRTSDKRSHSCPRHSRPPRRARGPQTQTRNSASFWKRLCATSDGLASFVWLEREGLDPKYLGCQVSPAKLETDVVHNARRKMIGCNNSP